MAKSRRRKNRRRDDCPSPTKKRATDADGTAANNNDCVKRQFTGGAQRARDRARRPHRDPSQNGDDVTTVRRIPNSLGPSERFYAALLSSPICHYESSSSDDDWTELMSAVCTRAGVPFPAPLPAQSPNPAAFYAARASLVLEESRCLLANALSSTPGRTGSGFGGGINVVLTRVREKPKKLSVALQFCKTDGYGGVVPFTSGELYHAKPGVVFQVSPSSYSSETSFLATVVPCSAKDRDGASVELAVFCASSGAAAAAAAGVRAVIGSAWRITPLTTLISEQRQFTACWKGVGVAFMDQLMGWKGATHVRFDSDGEEEEIVGEIGDDDEEEESFGEEKKMEDDADDFIPFEKECDDLEVSPFLLPVLNDTQEAAAYKFLNSDTGSLTLVQGPPGTGKTTFLTSVICRTLLTAGATLNLSKRLLVTAPTNKAISVLASRFLSALVHGIYTKRLNVVLIGVEDNLFPREEMPEKYGDDGASGGLRRIFVYTWIETIISEFQSLSRMNKDVSLLKEAKRLYGKLTSSIPYCAKKCGATAAVEKLSSLINEIVSSKEGASVETDKEQIFYDIMTVIVTSLQQISHENVVRELLSTAHIIFSTLTGTGSSIMKATPQVDDLFVDEAAATTEPNLLIPLHLRPKRLLAVGDPRQLPATVTSQMAQKLGLDKSLHERLMDSHVKKEFMMLGVQYRMRPEICLFPGRLSYEGGVRNGDNVLRPEYKASTNLFNNDPYTFLDTMGVGRGEQQFRDGSYYNPTEVEIIITILQQIPPSQYQNTRVITFYQAQVSHLQRMLRNHNIKNVLVSTVDSAQGSEADIVIVSFVRSQTNDNGSRRSYVRSQANDDALRRDDEDHDDISRQQRRRRGGFLSDKRRLNVALTRAKYQLICVGDASGTLEWCGIEHLKLLIQDARSRGALRDWKSWWS